MSQDNFSQQRTNFRLKDEWMTPPKVLDRIRKVASIGLDPFGNDTSFVGARVTNLYDPNDPNTDGFLQNWSSNLKLGEVAFMNPPFSRKADFADAWARNVSTISQKVVGGVFMPVNTLFCMLPANTEQPFFHKMMIPGSFLILYKTRLKYWEPNEDGLLVEGSSPPMASASFVYGDQASRIAREFRDIATCIHLG